MKILIFYSRHSLLISGDLFAGQDIKHSPLYKNLLPIHFVQLVEVSVQSTQLKSQSLQIKVSKLSYVDSMYLKPIS